ncbi:four and a half LIM domains protein 3 isoform X4 [Austrofundulus limnaeus]|uniref:Four and a half LIM domains protein 3 isoform X4 n=2 Tax=Austrofundulus limnaeus TaxID=52670 RepID=A0A2I4AHG6_AUSLI|nr:PREDICTED: four and a half LIM domains protein 3-like isoform X4 [Austrofundulus limnaeus]
MLRVNMSEKFSCKHCSQPLHGCKYIQVEATPHCITCYDLLFSNTCHECRGAISHNDKELSYEDRFYHELCFRCVRCERSLAGEAFTCQDQALLCSSCFCSSQVWSRCAACDGAMTPGSRMLEYGGAAWHQTCFLCHGCQKPIGSEGFVPDSSRFYCVPCYERQVAPRCSRCNKALTKGGVTYRDQVWHKDCFLCSGCRAPLANQPFTSQEESPFCITCFSNLHAKKCSGCHAPITGFGDGKYVSFEERQWHQPCFKCSRCSVSLLGSGFYPDRDQILCKDCNTEEEEEED